MTYPTVTDTTEYLFRGVPEYMQAADDGPWTLLRYIALPGDHLDTIAQVVETVETGDMTNAALMPDDAVRWMAQAVGITPQPWWSEELLRYHMANLPTYYLHGTLTAIVSSVLDRYPDAVSTVAVRHWRGNVWHIVVATPQSETPPTGAFITTLTELGETFPTLIDMAAEAPTLDDLATVDRVHLLVARTTRVEEPIGAQVFHVWADTVAGWLPEASASGVQPFTLGAAAVGEDVIVP